MTSRRRALAGKEKAASKKEQLTLGEAKGIRQAQQSFNRWLDSTLFNTHWEDGAFMDDVRQATLRGAHPAANALFWVMVAFWVVFLLWASVAELDEVTSGIGQVIPSGKVQTVQNLEGGIIKGIRVRQGDVVNPGDILIDIDDTGFASSFEEKRKRYYTLQAKTARLEAEISGEKPVFPQETVVKAPQIVEEANNLYLSRVGEFRSAKEILQRQVEQRSQELEEAKNKQTQTARSWELAQKEYDMAVPLQRDGVISEVELLRLERDVNTQLGEREAARLAVPKTEAALREAQSRLKEATLRFQNESRQELAEARDELARLEEILKAEADRVDRTSVRAPVRAEVKQVLVNTVGGVVQPGMDLVELVPLDDTLLVEAKIRPQDIAFVRPGQKSMVKITAYDFSIYGGLPGKLEQISPDTITDEEGEAFYKIRVRTERNYLGEGKDRLPIISGMIATVDILTGKKTVLDYLLKPLRKAREKALKER
jgi:adhesin transport system membrane fusion protein